ncbi:MAG: hypothetical protein JWQ66_2723 [Mucilaginibacter sp.]|nr:hypothetical protein [Mucilaginibacter sp.]
MTKFILIVMLFTGLWANYPTNIVGKWQVEDIVFTKFEANIPEQQKAMAVAFIRHTFLNAVFDFKADHHFYLSPAPPNMPTGQSWTYNARNGTINISETKGKGRLMQIKVTQKRDTTFFTMQETPIILKMHKKAG